jgi:hypothetical protein
MTAPCSLGIDIGVQSAIAILDQSGALLEIHDMPVLADGRAPIGRTRLLRLTEHAFEQLLEEAERLEARR